MAFAGRLASQRAEAKEDAELAFLSDKLDLLCGDKPTRRKSGGAKTERRTRSHSPPRRRASPPAERKSMVVEAPATAEINPSTYDPFRQ